MPGTRPLSTPMHGLTGFVIRRLLLGLVTLFVTSVMIFAATQALPGDAARSILGRSATPESLAELQRQLGLDKPVLTQYWEWISGVLTGDFGTSLANGLPVTEVIGERLVYSLFLMGIAAVISVPLGIALGAASARRRDSKFDQVTSVTTLGLASLPEFVVGITLAVVFATTVFQWLPAVAVTEPGVGPWNYPKELILPGDHARDRGRPLHGADHARVDGRDPRERLRGDGQAQGAAREPRPLASRRPERARPDVPGHRAQPRLPRGRHRGGRGGVQLPGRRAPARRLGARARHAGRPGGRAPDRDALRHPQPARRPRDDPRQPASADVSQRHEP